MSELESSGLLTRDAPEPESASHDGPQPSDATVKPQDSNLTPIASSQQADSQDAAEPNLAAAIVDAVTNDTVEVQKEQQGNAEEQGAQQDMADASEPAAADDAGEEGGEAAEQRVLGDLEGAPSWKEVRPTAAHQGCKGLWLPRFLFYVSSKANSRPVPDQHAEPMLRIGHCAISRSCRYCACQQFTLAYLTSVK